MMTNRPRPLKVMFTDVRVRDQVLRTGKNLHSSRFRSVFINKDLTPLQQTEQRTLTAELRRRRQGGEDVVIRGDKVVTRQEASQQLNFQRRF